MLGKTLSFVRPMMFYHLRRTITFPTLESSIEAFNSNMPAPDFKATRQDVVAAIRAEQAIVAANCELIVRFKKKSGHARPRGGEVAPAAQALHQ